MKGSPLLERLDVPHPISDFRFYFQSKETAERIVKLTREGKLRPVDSMTLFHLASHMNGSNVIRCTLSFLAKDRGVTRQSYIESTSRIRAAGLLARGWDARQACGYYMLHPGFACYGKPQERAAAWARFDKLLSVQEDEAYARAEARSRLRSIEGGRSVPLDEAGGAPTLESDDHGPEAA